MYSIIVDVSEPTVHEVNCYKIKISSGRIVTKDSIRVCHTHVPPKKFLTYTDRNAELKCIPIPEPTYRPFPPNSLYHPNPSVDHKGVSGIPDECQSEPRSKVKMALTSISKCKGVKWLAPV